MDSLEEAIMNTQEILLLILTSVGMGVIASVLVYLILAQKYKHTNNKMQTAKTLSPQKNNICTTSHQSKIKAIFCSMALSWIAGMLLLILYVIKQQSKFLFISLTTLLGSLALAILWVIIKKRFGDKISFNETCIIIYSLRIKERKKIVLWKDLDKISIRKDHLVLHISNEDELILNDLVSYDTFIEMAIAKKGSVLIAKE